MSDPENRGRLSSIDELDVIIDADSHVTENLDDLLPYMDEDRFGGVKELMSSSHIPLTEVYSASTATPIFRYHDDHDEVWGGSGVSTKLQQLGEFGIDHGILNPTTNLVLSSVNNTRFAVAIANAYNRWIIDQIEDAESSLKAGLLVPPQKPDKAAEEIDEWADEEAMGAVQLGAAGLVPPPGHSWYDPIYEAAQDNDMPIMMHTGGAITTKAFPVQFHWNETWAADHAISHPFSHMWNLTSMLFEGVPERFPDLEFVLQESGIAYLPYMMWRLDDHYLEMSYEIPALQKLPSEYIRDQFYITTQPLGHVADEANYIAQIIEMIGADRVMYSADLPHPDFDPPEDLFNRVRSDFDEQTVRNIMGETAKELYGF